MSSGSKQLVSHKGRFRWQWFTLLLFSIGVGLFFAADWGKFNPFNATVGQSVKSQVSTLKSPQTLDELLRLPPAELNRCDIALMDLLCAQGLPGTENMNIPDCFVPIVGIDDQKILRYDDVVA